MQKQDRLIHIHVNDELRKIGSGHRWVRIVSLGWKWVTVEDRLGRRQKLSRKAWDQIRVIPPSHEQEPVVPA